MARLESAYSDVLYLLTSNGHAEALLQPKIWCQPSEPVLRHVIALTSSRLAQPRAALMSCPLRKPGSPRPSKSSYQSCYSHHTPARAYEISPFHLVVPLVWPVQGVL